MGENVTVIDCDGHIIESIPEMVEYMDPRIRHERRSLHQANRFNLW